MIDAGNGDPNGLPATAAAELAAFDSLDAATRLTLNYAPLNYSATSLVKLGRGGSETVFGFRITKPDLFAAHVAKIREMHAAVLARDIARGTGAQQKVSRETLRRSHAAKVLKRFRSKYR